MKRNDTLGYLVYVIMIALAAVIGVVVVRPDFTRGDFNLHPAVISLLAILASAFVSALLLELGHLIGAKAGKYEVVKWLVFGIGFEKKEDGKKHAVFKEFDGLTGETYAIPKDIEKSNPKKIIWFGLLGLFIEILVSVVFIIVGTVISKTLFWLKVVGEISLTIGVMILFYDIFPAALDNKNDGYLMMILNTKTNREAYNFLLTSNYLTSNGKEAPEIKVYDDVTDFTSAVNDVTMYKHLNNKDYKSVIEISEKTIASKKKVSSQVYANAVAQKLCAIIMSKPFEEAKEYFIDMSMDDKKKISQLNSIQTVRAYILANGIIEESESETRTGLDSVQGKFRKVPKEYKDIEKKALLEEVELVHEHHPHWDFSEYPFWKDAHPEDDGNKDEDSSEKSE